MSGSDSDLDFESADEDTEFACSSKSNVCQKSISEEAPSESVSREGDVSSKISTSEIDECTDMSSKQHSSDGRKETVEDSAKSDKSQDSKIPETASISNPDSVLAESEFKSLQQVDCLNKEANASSTKCASELLSVSSEKNPNPTESEPARERVVLRLEKKKQLAKESPVESEKPSNSVNILQDPEEKRQPSSWGFSSWASNLKSDNSQVLEIDSIQNPDCVLPESELKPHQQIDSVNKEAPSTKCASVSSEKNPNPTESKPERERVVLRLEKKKQLAKESPVESEKPSDFVNILQDPEEKKQPSSWGFSSWGSSLLSSAASSVSTFSNQVSQGIGNVLDTVESTLGAPAPEDLAQALNEKKAETNAEEEKESEGRSGLLPDMSSWTKVLENTGSTVLMGGLNTLELIGKKTMDILTEGDPGLRNKRAAFSGDANLSELLREIKSRADEQTKASSEEVHYSQIFDEKQGLVHLEALEMLSKQSQAKFQRLLMRHAKHSEVKKRLEEIKSICENIPSLDDPSDCETFEDFEAVFQKYALGLSFPLNVDNIIKTQREISETISNYENAAEDSHSPPKEIFQSAVCSLADFTAKCIETFHKAAELLLVQPNLHPDLEHCATNLTGLTTVMCIEVNNLSSRYHKCLEATTECLQKKGISENADVKTLATNVYVEASNSNNYIQDAYQMLVPVLQVRFLEAID